MAPGFSGGLFHAREHPMGLVAGEVLIQQRQVDFLLLRKMDLEQRIQAVEANEAIRIEAADPLRGTYPKPERRMHRHRDAHKARVLHLGVVECLNRKIEDVGLIARPLQERAWPGDPERLVAKLVAGNEEQGARRA